jgi:hypothetical protein
MAFVFFWDSPTTDPTKSLAVEITTSPIERKLS